MAKYFIDDQWSATGRVELYVDGDEVIITNGTENGFHTSGYSLGIDCRILENVVWRIEGRMLSSKDDMFMKDKDRVSSNLCLTTSLAIAF